MGNEWVTLFGEDKLESAGGVMVVTGMFKSPR